MGHLQKDQYYTSTLQVNENECNRVVFRKPGFLCGFQNCVSDTYILFDLLQNACLGTGLMVRVHPYK